MSKIILYDGFYDVLGIGDDDPKTLAFLSDFFDDYTDEENDFDFREWIEKYTEEEGVYLPKGWFHDFCVRLLLEANIPTDVANVNADAFIYEAGGRGWDEDEDNYYVSGEAIEAASPV